MGLSPINLFSSCSGRGACHVGSTENDEKFSGFSDINQSTLKHDQQQYKDSHTEHQLYEHAPCPACSSKSLLVLHTHPFLGGHSKV